MNNKKMNKKGFTIVELVIVIAVIAILAGVMIPTFGGIITTANESAVKQAAAATYKQVFALDMADGVENGKKNSTEDIGTIDGVAQYLTGDRPTSGCYYEYDYDATGTDPIFTYVDTVKKIKATTLDGSAWTASSLS